MTTAGIRQLHAYIGLFIAPSVLFFALTGAVQLFDLHEAHGGYRPFPLIEKLSSVHKAQVFAFGDHHVDAAAGSDVHDPAADAAGQADEDKVSTVVLRSFFLVVALCLVISALLGIWMGLTQTRRKRIACALLAAGTVIPIGLLIL